MDETSFSNFITADLDTFYSENVFNLDRGNKYYCLFYFAPLESVPESASKSERFNYFANEKILRVRSDSPGIELAHEGGYFFILADKLLYIAQRMLLDQFGDLKLPDTFYFQVALVNTRGKTIANNKDEKEFMLEDSGQSLSRIKTNCIRSETRTCSQPFLPSDYDEMLKRMITDMCKSRAQRLDL